MLTCPELKKFNSDGRHQSAGVAHPVERHLAKVEVASSSLVTRSIIKDIRKDVLFSILFSGRT